MPSGFRFGNLALKSDFMTEELPAYDDSDATVNPAEEGVVVPFPSPARLEELFRVSYSQRLDCPTGSRFRALDLTT